MLPPIHCFAVSFQNFQVKPKAVCGHPLTQMSSLEAAAYALSRWPRCQDLALINLMVFEGLTKQGSIVCQSCVLRPCDAVASLWQHVPVRTTEKVELSLCRGYGCPERSLGDFWKIFWESLALSNQERNQRTVGWKTDSQSQPGPSGLCPQRPSSLVS